MCAMERETNDFDTQLGSLADEARRDEAIRARRQRADRRLAAALSGTFTGTLMELSETGTTVTVLTRTGSTVRGHIVEVGPEVIVVHVGNRSRVLVSRNAIEGLRESGAGHNRTVLDVPEGPEMASILDGHAGHRDRASFTLSTGNRLMGIIDRVGVDQIVVSLDGDGESMTIPLTAIDQVVLPL